MIWNLKKLMQMDKEWRNQIDIVNKKIDDIPWMVKKVAEDICRVENAKISSDLNDIVKNIKITIIEEEKNGK